MADPIFHALSDFVSYIWAEVSGSPDAASKSQGGSGMLVDARDLLLVAVAAGFFFAKRQAGFE